MRNKRPEWSPESQSYVLNFHGRVTRASVKNFQIVSESCPEEVVMQFGKVGADIFTMDFRLVGGGTLDINKEMSET